MTHRGTSSHPNPPPPRQTVWRGLRQQFLLKLLWPLVLAFVLAASITAAINYRQELHEQRQWRTQIIEAFGNALIQPLWDCDDSTTRGIMQMLSQMPSVHSAQLQDLCAGLTVEMGTLSTTGQTALMELLGTPLSQPHAAGTPSDQTGISRDSNAPRHSPYPASHTAQLALPADATLPLLLVRTLEYRDEHNRRFVVGHLVLEFTPFSVLQASSKGLAEQLLTFATILLAVFSVVALVFRITIERPLTQLHQAMLQQKTVHGLQPPTRRVHDELTDVTDVYDQLLQELQSQAQQDALTGLGNRTVLEHHLRQALHRTDPQPRTTHSYVLLLDLDGFKPINDTYGHAAGDYVLQSVAQRLRDVTRSSDTVTRLGGDEFVIIAHDYPSEQEMPRIVQRIVQAVEAPLQFGPHVLQVGVSVGYACIEHNESSTETLLAQADHAMYLAKQARKAAARPAGAPPPSAAAVAP